MANVRVITDSACDLPSELTAELDVDVVSLHVRFGDEEFIDRLELSPAQFWARCAESAKLPQTSAPSAGDFAAAYARAASDGCDGVVVLTLSSLLSATFQAATLAASEFEGPAVRVIDTRNVTLGEGLLVLEAAERARAGGDLDDIERSVRAAMSRSGVVAALDTLDHLVKGGRVGGARALVGQVLSIKPLLELREGVVAEAGRQRTRSRALGAIAERVHGAAPFERLALFAGDCDDVARLESLVDDVETRHPMLRAELGPVVGTHGGPGIIGLAWIAAPASKFTA